MKELFNTLSNVSDFFAENRYIYQRKAPKPTPKATETAKAKPRKISKVEVTAEVDKNIVETKNKAGRPKFMAKVTLKGKVSYADEKGATLKGLAKAGKPTVKPKGTLTKAALEKGVAKLRANQEKVNKEKGQVRASVAKLKSSLIGKSGVDRRYAQHLRKTLSEYALNVYDNKGLQNALKYTAAVSKAISESDSTGALQSKMRKLNNQYNALASLG